jgi:hypothetical protein
LAKVGINHLPSNPSKLLRKCRGGQSEDEKCKFGGTSRHRPESKTKTFFDVGTDWIGSLYPKIPDGSEIYVVRLKPLHTPILIRPTTSGRHNLASIQQSVSKPPTSIDNFVLRRDILKVQVKLQKINELQHFVGFQNLQAVN